MISFVSILRGEDGVHKGDYANFNQMEQSL